MNKDKKLQKLISQSQREILELKNPVIIDDGIENIEPLQVRIQIRKSIAAEELKIKDLMKELRKRGKQTP